MRSTIKVSCENGMGMRSAIKVSCENSTWSPVSFKNTENGQRLLISTASNQYLLYFSMTGQFT